ncbi:MAG: hypothetical protein NTV00_10310 [Methylococcales bacterium]|nr:hypothetical protein [Methylococcales bacterium]
MHVKYIVSVELKGGSFQYRQSLAYELNVRRQLPCPVGDNYLDRLTDM